METIEKYEIINHGIHNSSYFQGCSVAFTEFSHVATGIGKSEHEAFQDALDLLAQADYETDEIQSDVDNEVYTCLPCKEDICSDCDHDCCEMCERYVHISIRVK